MTDAPQILLAHDLEALKFPTYDTQARQCEARPEPSRCE
jgi:hypothetical protein